MSLTWLSCNNDRRAVKKPHRVGAGAELAQLYSTRLVVGKHQSAFHSAQLRAPMQGRGEGDAAASVNLGMGISHDDEKSSPVTHLEAVSCVLETRKQID